MLSADSNFDGLKYDIHIRTELLEANSKNETWLKQELNKLSNLFKFSFILHVSRSETSLDATNIVEARLTLNPLKYTKHNAFLLKSTKAAKKNYWAVGP